MATIRVTAGKDRLVPIHKSMATAPGGALLYLRPGDELEVDDSDAHTIRYLRDGDFVKVEKPRELAAGERFIAAPDAPPVHNPELVGSMQHLPESVLATVGTKDA